MNKEKEKMVCGVVMPISSIDGCNESHWADVLEIISESIESAGFESNLVSHADESGVIHKRIIQNLYENPIVVCDVSGKNPNVMFELGMRLAFDKPTIIIKDDITSYSFDMSAIEHLEYPRDLRFSKIIDFKENLSQKIKATYEKSKTDKNYTTFLKHFGEFTVAKIDKKEVSGQEYILEELKNIRFAMRRLERQSPKNSDSEEVNYRHSRLKSDIDICFGRQAEEVVLNALQIACEHQDVKEAYLYERGADHRHLVVNLKNPTKENIVELEQIIERIKINTRKNRSKVINES